MKALKRYGQNFLTDKNILSLIVSRSGACENDCVLEIGPGHGVLTRALLDSGVKYLHTIELDGRLRPELEELAGQDSRLMLHWGDAVKYDYAGLNPFPNKVIANIPYNITTPLIWELLKYSSLGLRYYLFMLQKEAAERIIAPKDTKARYPLGVMIEAMGRAAIIRRVAPQCFRPVPKVESALTEIVIERNFGLAHDDAFSELLHLGFSHRRKTLANNLKGYVDAGSFGKFRAEDLSCDEWLEVYAGTKKIPPNDQYGGQ